MNPMNTSASAAPTPLNATPIFGHGPFNMVANKRGILEMQYTKPKPTATATQLLSKMRLSKEALAEQVAKEKTGKALVLRDQLMLALSRTPPDEKKENSLMNKLADWIEGGVELDEAAWGFDLNAGSSAARGPTELAILNKQRLAMAETALERMKTLISNLPSQSSGVLKVLRPLHAGVSLSLAKASQPPKLDLVAPQPAIAAALSAEKTSIQRTAALLAAHAQNPATVSQANFQLAQAALSLHKDSLMLAQMQLEEDARNPNSMSAAQRDLAKARLAASVAELGPDFVKEMAERQAWAEERTQRELVSRQDLSKGNESMRALAKANATRLLEMRKKDAELMQSLQRSMGGAPMSSNRGPTPDPFAAPTNTTTTTTTTTTTQTTLTGTTSTNTPRSTTTGGQQTSRPRIQSISDDDL